MFNVPVNKMLKCYKYFEQFLIQYEKIPTKD